jgi:DNA-binding CsgD family transcriptional regulator
MPAAVDDGERRERDGEPDEPIPTREGRSMDSTAQALGTETPLRSATADVAAVDRDGPLIAAARPVIDQLASDVADTGIVVALTNARGNVLDVRGTGRSLSVRRDAAGAGAPITDPRSGRAVGTLDLTCRAADANPLMQPLAARAAREIEQRLVDDPGLHERLTLHRFLKKRRGAKCPFVLVTPRRLITNAAADRLVGSHDEPVLRDAAERLCDGRERGAITLALTGGTVAARAEPVPDNGSAAGTILQLTPLVRGGGSSGHRQERALWGWESLTGTERSVALLVAEGLTNREAAERLFLSPHTVDFHLRSVFRKFGTRSRVHLTRLIVQAEHEREGA